MDELRKRRVVVALVAAALFVLVGVNPQFLHEQVELSQSDILSQSVDSELAANVLDRIEVKGRAPKSGYSRSEFGDGWAQVQGCDVRNIMLSMGMTDIAYADDNCIVLNGTLEDPYTGTTIEFARGSTTSSKVQIDHVVALSDSWQKGAQMLEYEERVRFANDSLNLLAVDGPANQQKGGSDAASWLPSNKSFRCQYVARQIAVKEKYGLWITEAEESTMKRVLNGCGGQVVPVES